MSGRTWLGPLLALGLVSCGKAPNHPPVFPVEGRVSYEGRPASGAVVLLHPTDEAAMTFRPHGRANERGEFELTTFRTADGAPAGTYVVTVQWRRAEDHPEQGDDLLPSVYSDPKTSMLRVTVTPGPNEPLELSLRARP